MLRAFLSNCFSVCVPRPAQLDFEKEEEIGHGTYAKVYRAKTSSGKWVAIKHLSKHDCAEVDIVRSLFHPNIVSFVDTRTQGSEVHLIMEYCADGDLFDWIHNHERTEIEASLILHQLCAAVQYLHAQHLVHGDLKLSNLMIQGTTLKVIDFGMAQRIIPEAQLSQLVGSSAFMAPEVWVGAYTEACDLWSVGCIAFILLFGFNPFNPTGSLPAQRVRHNTLCGFTPEVRHGFGAWFPKSRPISAEARDFIAHLLTSDWKMRMTASEALSHVWLN